MPDFDLALAGSSDVEVRISVEEGKTDVFEKLRTRAEAVLKEKGNPHPVFKLIQGGKYLDSENSINAGKIYILLLSSGAEEIQFNRGPATSPSSSKATLRFANIARQVSKLGNRGGSKSKVDAGQVVPEEIDIEIPALRAKPNASQSVEAVDREMGQLQRAVAAAPPPVPGDGGQQG